MDDSLELPEAWHRSWRFTRLLFVIAFHRLAASLIKKLRLWDRVVGRFGTSLDMEAHLRGDQRALGSGLMDGCITAMQRESEDSHLGVYSSTR